MKLIALLITNNVATYGGIIYKDFPLEEVKFKKGNQPQKEEDDEEE